MSKFDHYLNAVLERGAREAHDDGASAVDAHHILLAMAAGSDPVLTAAGLDHAAVRAALDQEFARSLGAAGVTLTTALRRGSRPPQGSPGLGASARAAIERGFAAVSRKRDVRRGHLLYGILSAQFGTVPRALDLAGVDRAELSRAALAESVR
jgi:D-alanyl-D-alanine carboxypeptidase